MSYTRDLNQKNGMNNEERHVITSVDTVLNRNKMHLDDTNHAEP